MLAEQIRAAFTHQWRTGNCRVLAQIARKLLELKARSHDALGELVERLLERTEHSVIEREVACALVKNISLPTDAALIETARALRLLGIYMCAQFGRDLNQCWCLKDLVNDVIEQCAHDLNDEFVHNLALEVLASVPPNARIRGGPQLAYGEIEAIIRNALRESRPQRRSQDE